MQHNDRGYCNTDSILNKMMVYLHEGTVVVSSEGPSVVEGQPDPIRSPDPIPDPDPTHRLDSSVVGSVGGGSVLIVVVNMSSIS